VYNKKARCDVVAKERLLYFILLNQVKVQPKISKSNRTIIKALAEKVGPVTNIWRSQISGRLIYTELNYSPCFFVELKPALNNKDIRCRKYKKNSMVSVRERTIPTERPPLVGEVIANFCG
jgi:hypothetical protein